MNVEQISQPSNLPSTSVQLDLPQPVPGPLPPSNIVPVVSAVSSETTCSTSYQPVYTTLQPPPQLLQQLPSQQYHQSQPLATPAHTNIPSSNGGCTPRNGAQGGNGQSQHTTVSQLPRLAPAPSAPSTPRTSMVPAPIRPARAPLAPTTWTGNHTAPGSFQSQTHQVQGSFVQSLPPLRPAPNTQQPVMTSQCGPGSQFVYPSTGQMIVPGTNMVPMPMTQQPALAPYQSGQQAPPNKLPLPPQSYTNSSATRPQQPILAKKSSVNTNSATGTNPTGTMPNASANNGQRRVSTGTTQLQPQPVTYPAMAQSSMIGSYPMASLPAGVMSIASSTNPTVVQSVSMATSAAPLSSAPVQIMPMMANAAGHFQPMLFNMVPPVIGHQSMILHPTMLQPFMTPQGMVAAPQAVAMTPAPSANGSLPASVAMTSMPPVYASMSSGTPMSNVCGVASLPAPSPALHAVAPLPSATPVSCYTQSQPQPSPMNQSASRQGVVTPRPRGPRTLPPNPRALAQMPSSAATPGGEQTCQPASRPLGGVIRPTGPRIVQAGGCGPKPIAAKPLSPGCAVESGGVLRSSPGKLPLPMRSGLDASGRRLPSATTSPRSVGPSGGPLQTSPGLPRLAPSVSPGANLGGGVNGASGGTTLGGGLFGLKRGDAQHVLSHVGMKRKKRALAMVHKTHRPDTDADQGRQSSSGGVTTGLSVETTSTPACRTSPSKSPVVSPPPSGPQTNPVKASQKAPGGPLIKKRGRPPKNAKHNTPGTNPIPAKTQSCATKENARTLLRSHTTSEAVAKGKQGRRTAVVRPEQRKILTHLIDGHVIYESDKPFPVKRGMEVVEAVLLGKPPTKKIRSDVDDVESEECVAMESRCKEEAVSVCEGCSTKLSVLGETKTGLCAKCRGMMQNSRDATPQPPSTVASRSSTSPPVKELVPISSHPIPVEISASTETGQSEATTPHVDEKGNQGDEAGFPLTRDISEWSVDAVYEFVRSTPGCSIYATAFRSNEIDGEALLLLTEDHLIQPPISMKVGPALKLSARIEEMRQ